MLLGFRMPLRFLRGQTARLALTVVALACGVGMVCAIDLVNRAVVWAFVDVVDGMAGRAALFVQAGAGGLFPEDVADAVAAVPGVVRAVPVVQATAFTTDGRGDALAVHGVDVGDEGAVRVYEARDGGGLELDDPLVFLSRPDSVVLTRAFAERRGLAVDDPIELMTPTGRQRFVVRGLLDPEGVARIHGGNLVVMDLFAAELHFTRRGLVNRVDVVIDPGADVERVAAAVRAALPPGMEVEAPAQRKADLNRVMRSLHALLDAIALVGLVHVQGGFAEAPLDVRVLDALATVPGVRTVIGDRIADWRHGDEAIAINAYDAAYFRDGRFGRWPLAAGSPEDVWPRVARGEAVTVSHSFAMNFGVRPGDVLTLDTPRGPLRRPVAGVAREFVSARGSVQMNRALYEEYWADGQVTLILIEIDPGRDPESVRAAIAAGLGGQYQLRILVPEALIAHYVGEVRRAFAGVDVLRLLVLVVVLIGMADMLAASVAERTLEIGALRALGVAPRVVRRIVLLEAVLVGCIGLTVAGVAGGSLGALWVRTTFPDLLGWVLALHLPWRRVASIAAMAVGVCVLAAIVPAWRAAALAPAVALREE